MTSGQETMADDGIIGWVLAGIMSMATALASTVAYLYRAIEGKNSQAIETVKHEVACMRLELDKCESKHDECLKDREKINVELATLRGEMNAVKSQVKQV